MKCYGTRATAHETGLIEFALRRCKSMSFFTADRVFVVENRGISGCNRDSRH